MDRGGVFLNCFIHRPFVAFTVLLILMAPLASAAPTAPAALSVLVRETGTTQTVEFKFPKSSNDPGTWTYNLTIDSGSPVEVSDVASQLDVTNTSTFITFSIEIVGGTAAYAAHVHGWDGVDEGSDSCTVNFDTANEGHYASCGTFPPTYEEVHCFDGDNGNDFGFSDTYRVSTVAGQDNAIYFEATGDEAAWAGLNLGRDTTELNFTYEMKTRTDGGTSKILFFFSEVSATASELTVGNAATALRTGFSIPNTGAFREGYGVSFVENGADFDVKIFKNTNGATKFHFNDTWSDGINANSFTSGQFFVSEYTNQLNLTLGGEAASVSLTDMGAPDDFQTFWITEFGGGFFNLATSIQTVDGSSGCLYSLDEDLGGAGNAIGAPSGGQPLEDFDGQGGFGGQPMFPGIDVASTATDFGMDARILGYVLGAILVISAALLGFATAGSFGAGFGGVLGFLGTGVLNLSPWWFIILALLLSSTVIALSNRGAAS